MVSHAWDLNEPRTAGVKGPGVYIGGELGGERNHVVSCNLSTGAMRLWLRFMEELDPG